MNLEELFLKLRTDPTIITEIELEIKRCVEESTVDSVYVLFKSDIPEMKLYAFKILEERIKNKKRKGIVPADEIGIMNEVIHNFNNDKAAYVFALLGLYEWPTVFPNFFPIVIDLLSHKNEMGYKILHNFLYLCNYSQEIDESRKTELKKAVSIMSEGYMPLFDDSMAKHVIPILTESLRIIPKTFDCSIVLRKGREFLEQTIEFLSEGMELLKLVDVINLIAGTEVNAGMIVCFNGLKNKAPNVSNLNLMYEYIFKGLRKDLLSFSASIEFWTKLFGQVNPKGLAGEILTEVTSIYLSVDEEQRNEIEGEVLGLFNVICKNCRENAVEFLKLNGDFISRKLTLYFIKKLFDFPGSSAIPADLAFKDSFLDCTVAFYRKDPTVINYIQYFDFNDKESCKLVVKIIETYALSDEKLNEILGKCNIQNKEHCNEVIVECFTRLGKKEEFDGSWDFDKFIRLFFYLKKEPEVYSYLKPSYFEAFKKDAPFDRCFAILKMFGDIPEEIFMKIYSDIDKYPFVHLACFNRDLLQYISFQEAFIQKEIVRFIEEWKISEEPADLIACVKSLIQVIILGISDPQIQSPFINELIELLQIDDPNIVRRICNILSTYSGAFDTKRAVYLLMLAYNSSIIENTHIIVGITLTNCLKQEDGPEAFNEVLGIEIDKCRNLKSEVLRNQSKRAQNLVRVFLQDYKGKPLNKLYSDDFKVGGQNFIKKDSSSGRLGSIEIPRNFFES